MVSNITTKGLLRYPGGKTRAVKTLNSYIPDTVTSVRAPFFGGGSFELHLTGRGIRVTAFDLFPQLVTFWQQVLIDPQGLSDAIRPHLGTMNKDKFYDIQNKLRSSDFPDQKELAAAFFIVNRCSFSGTTLSGGMSSAAASGRFTESSVNRIRDFRNDLLTVQYGDAFDTILEGDEDVLFLDPPYALENSNLYGDKGSHHDDFDHERMRDVVVESGREFLLTYNNNDYIRDLWKDYDQIETSWSYGMNSSKKSSELIIYSR